MVSSITAIGLTKIVAPEVDKLLLSHGQALAKDHFSDGFLKGFIGGRCCIALLIPEALPRFSPNGGSTVMAEFFQGVLESFLEQVRDEKFPELKVQANRKIIMDVSLDRPKKDIVTVMVEAVAGGSEVYKGFAEFIKPKIKLGILHADESITYADIYGEDSSTNFDFSNPTAVKLEVYSDKYKKALHGMFSSNFSYSGQVNTSLSKPDPKF